MSNYSFLDKILYRQFLSDTPLSNYLYNRLVTKSKRQNPYRSYSHVFITGLARSGTTALLNNLYSSNQFASIVYRDMPFILSPKLAYISSRYLQKKDIKVIQRLHNDGIKFSINSPECLDEVFWIKASSGWFSKRHLKVYSPSNDVMNAYSYFLGEFAQNNLKKRMIVKNNNNHVRLLSLAKYFSKSFFLVLFREPISQSFSLLNQHINFTSIQSKEPFVLEFMDMIGHKEFGLNVAPFVYEKSTDLKYLRLPKSNVNYWLSQWIATYSWLLSLPIKRLGNIRFISYEQLCKQDSIYLSICKSLNIDLFGSVSIPNQFIPGKYSSLDFDKSQLENEKLIQANQIYDKLIAISHN